MSLVPYVPVDFSKADAIFAYAMLGLEVSDGAWLIDGLQITRIGWRSWHWIEHRDTARDNDLANRFLACQPFFAVLPFNGVAGLSSPEDPFQHLRGLRPYTDQLIGDLVLALRLHDPSSDFVDPLFAVVYGCAGGQMWREASYYRQGVWSISVENPYRVNADRAPAVESLFARVRRYHGFASNVAIDLALKHFRLSYGPRIDDERRLRYLLIALEAVLGSFREKRGGAPLYARAGYAADRLGIGGGEVETFLRGDGRKLRNHIAHGDTGDPPIALGHGRDMFRRALVPVLTDVMRFALVYPSAYGAIRGLVGDYEASTPTLAYSALLARAASDPSARELLDFQPPFDFMND
jgi:hypothetical protein